MNVPKTNIITLLHKKQKHKVKGSTRLRLRIKNTNNNMKSHILASEFQMTLIYIEIIPIQYHSRRESKYEIPYVNHFKL